MNTRYYNINYTYFIVTLHHFSLCISNITSINALKRDKCKSSSSLSVFTTTSEGLKISSLFSFHTWFHISFHIEIVCLAVSLISSICNHEGLSHSEQCLYIRNLCESLHRVLSLDLLSSESSFKSFIQIWILYNHLSNRKRNPTPFDCSC